MTRYARQLALPDISQAQQERLAASHICMVGAGGLGAAALPYLAAAGVGRLTIYDNDTVSISNLHRQTIYKNEQEGQNKAEAAAAYLRALNPEINVQCHPERLALKDLDSSAPALQNDLPHYDLILDGSDNFETKTLLNKVSIEKRMPLISASVNQWRGQIGVFAGFAAGQPCYHCLFPELPGDTRNCNEAGILGTSAGLTGMWQAHLALCFLLGMENVSAGHVLSFDFKDFRMQNLRVKKDASCPHCAHGQANWSPYRAEKKMTDLISLENLNKREHIIIDVRADWEIEADPIIGAKGEILHIELTSIPSRYNELPRDKLLAFVCAGNIRSAQAAEYLASRGYENICVLDKFSL